MTPDPVRTPRRPRCGARTGSPGRSTALSLLLAAVAVLLSAGPAAAHVLPSTVVELDVHDDRIDGEVLLPAADLATASGLPLVGTDGTGLAAEPATADAVAAYLLDHVQVSSAAGPWTVAVDDVTTTTDEQYGTGSFPAVSARLELTPPAGAEVHRFDLTWDAIVHQVVTADTYLVLRSDDTGELTGSTLPVSLGVVATDTVTGSVRPVTVDLTGGDPGSATTTGFLGMLTLGISHIAEGTDHQLFLLTLLLPAPLLSHPVDAAGPTSAAASRLQLGRLLDEARVGPPPSWSTPASGARDPRRRTAPGLPACCPPRGGRGPRPGRRVSRSAPRPVPPRGPGTPPCPDRADDAAASAVGRRRPVAPSARRTPGRSSEQASRAPARPRPPA